MTRLFRDAAIVVAGCVACAWTSACDDVDSEPRGGPAEPDADPVDDDTREYEYEPNSSDPEQLTERGGKLLFFAGTEAGHALWSYDPEEGAVQVAALPERGRFEAMGVHGDRLYLSAATPSYGDELWLLGDGGTTALAADIVPGPESSYPSLLTGFGDHLYFGAWHQSAGPLLWQYDGASPPVPVAGVSSPKALSVMGDRLYFVADSSDAVHVWQYDGSGAPQIVAGPQTPHGYWWGVFPFRGQLYIPTGKGQLWRYDGDNPATLIADVEPTSLSPLAVLDDQLYIGVGDTLARVDGDTLTTVATGILFTFGLPVVDGHILYGRAGDADEQLWKFDGQTETPIGITAAPYPRNALVVGGVLYYAAADGNGTELWRYDGVEPPAMAVDLYPGGDWYED